MFGNSGSYERVLDQNDNHVLLSKSVNLKELQSILKFDLFFRSQSNLPKLSKSHSFKLIRLNPS